MPNKFLMLIIVLMVFVFSSLSKIYAQEPQEQDYINFVNQLLSKVYKELPNKKNMSQVNNYFTEVTQQNFALDYMAAWALGRYRNSIEDGLKDRYIKAAKEYMILVYGSVFYKYYQSYEFKVISAEQKGSEYWVTVSVKLKPNSKIKVPDNEKQILSVWKIRPTKDNNFLITDIIVANISLLNTQQAEFTALIKKENDNVEKFVLDLENKVKTMKVQQGIK